jgi:hypothetical protein
MFSTNIVIGIVTGIVIGTGTETAPASHQRSTRMNVPHLHQWASIF